MGHNSLIRTVKAEPIVGQKLTMLREALAMLNAFIESPTTGAYIFEYVRFLLRTEIERIEQLAYNNTPEYEENWDDDDDDQASAT